VTGLPSVTSEKVALGTLTRRTVVLVAKSSLVIDNPDRHVIEHRSTVSLVLLLQRQQQTGRWSEAEDQGKGIVYRSELIGIETPRGPPKSLWIYHGGLLDEDSGLGPVE
jgi:hypothetical protein